MPLDNTELADAVAAETAVYEAAGKDNAPSWKIRTSLLIAVNDAALRLAKASGVFEHGRQSDSTVQFVAGALRCAVSAADDPSAADLERMTLAGISAGETSISGAELADAVATERGYWNTAASMRNDSPSISSTATAVRSWSYCSWLVRRPLLSCTNDAAMRVAQSQGKTPFGVPNRELEVFVASALRLAVLATDSPTSADSARLVAAGL